MVIFTPRWNSLLQLPFAPSLVQIVLLCVVNSSCCDSCFRFFFFFAYSLWIQLQQSENQAKVWDRALYHRFFSCYKTASVWPGTILSQDKLLLTRQSLGTAGGTIFIREKSLMGSKFRSNCVWFGLSTPSSKATPGCFVSVAVPHMFSSQCPNLQHLSWLSWYQTIISWQATVLTYLELECTQKIITNVSSGHLRGK